MLVKLGCRQAKWGSRLGTSASTQERSESRREK
jgi:hypothetical protein